MGTTNATTPTPYTPRQYLSSPLKLRSPDSEPDPKMRLQIKYIIFMIVLNRAGASASRRIKRTISDANSRMKRAVGPHIKFPASTALSGKRIAGQISPLLRLDHIDDG